MNAPVSCSGSISQPVLFYNGLNARCQICVSTELLVERNGDGRLVAICIKCGNVTQPADTLADLKAQLRWLPASEPTQEQPSALEMSA